MILVWFNPNHLTFYSRYLIGYFSDYHVGFVNSYGHFIVQILVLDKNNKLKSIYSYDEYTYKKYIRKKRHSLKNRLIHYAYKFLEKIE